MPTLSTPNTCNVGTKTASVALKHQPLVFLPGDEMDARNQVNKEVTRQAFAIICKAAPAEESNGVKGAFGRTIQKSIPINRLFAGVRGNRVDPSAARAVAVGRIVGGRDRGDRG